MPNATNAPEIQLEGISYRKLKERKGSVVTGNIITSFLKTFDIIAKPDYMPKHFRWFEPLFDGQDPATMDIDTSLLYICDIKDAEALLARSQLLVIIALTKDTEVPAWFESNKNRVMIIHCEDRYLYLTAVIQNLFTSLLVWEYELDRIVISKGSLGELLDEGATMLNTFMCITDAGYNMIARTNSIKPESDASLALVNNGCYPASEVEYIENNVTLKNMSSSFSVLPPHEGNNQSTLHMPIYCNGCFFFMLSIDCSSDMDQAGFMDFASIVAARVSALCDTFWQDILFVDSPWHKLLTNFIESVPMTDKYISEQLDLIGCSDAKQFKLLMFNFDESMNPSARDKAIKAAAQLNNKMCYPFAFNGRLLVLCYLNTTDDGHFSTRRTAVDVEECMYKKFGITGTASRIFNDLHDMGFAYQQTLFTEWCIPILRKERALAGLDENNACFSFEYALPYYMLIGDKSAHPFGRFCAQYNILEKLAREDAKNGSEVTKLLWTYLSFDRNATAVAKQLHMHRNTVLYHIDKIEKRFDFDLSEPMNRNKMLADFHFYFLTDGFTKEIEFIQTPEITNVDTRRIN